MLGISLFSMSFCVNRAESVRRFILISQQRDQYLSYSQLFSSSWNIFLGSGTLYFLCSLSYQLYHLSCHCWLCVLGLNSLRLLPDSVLHHLPPFPSLAVLSLWVGLWISQLSMSSTSSQALFPVNAFTTPQKCRNILLCIWHLFNTDNENFCFSPETCFSLSLFHLIK